MATVAVKDTAMLLSKGSGAKPLTQQTRRGEPLMVPEPRTKEPDPDEQKRAANKPGRRQRAERPHQMPRLQVHRNDLDCILSLVATGVSATISKTGFRHPERQRRPLTSWHQQQQGWRAS